jgi:inner membrane protein
MASLGHVAVGLLAGRLHGGSSPRRTVIAMGAFVTLAMVPDCDVVGLALFGQPDQGMLGHRGFTHSVVFAGGVALVAWFVARKLGLRPLTTALFSFLVVASHGPLDAFTTDSRGIPLLWPFSEERIVSPWRPIPVAPTGLRFVSVRGVEVALVEIIYFLPVIFLAVWPRVRARAEASFRRVLLAGATIVFAVGSCLAMAELLLRDSRVVTWLDRSARTGMTTGAPPRPGGAPVSGPRSPGTRGL